MRTLIIPVILCACVHYGNAFRQLGIVSIDMPGFSNLYEHPGWTDPLERYSLLLSTFSPIPFTVDTSYVFRHIGKDLGRLGQVSPIPLYDEFTWPREIRQTPVDVFGFETVTQPDGFLVPGKNYGAIYIVDMRGFPQTSPTTHNIVEDWSGDYEAWFYHRVLWKDMDGDGKKDALACRARRTILGGDTTELVWFRQPADPFGRIWEKTFINNECDTMSILTTMTAGGQELEALFTVGYFTQRLVVHWSDAPDGSWANPNNIRTRTIDTGGQFFDLELADLNKDGRRDLLVTINAEVGGSLEVYEIPNDFRTGTYTKHTLADGFDSRSGLGGGGAPGTGFTFYPTVAGETSGEKPMILLSGDDDGRAYYMTPRSADAASWEYNLVTLVDEGTQSIIGKLSAADFDGDGYKEVFVPSYFGDRMFVFTLSPGDE